MGIFRPKIKIFHRALFQILGYHASKTCLKFMKNLDNFFLFMRMWLPKIIDFRQIFGEKNFMDPLFYSKIQKILFLINIIILITYYFKNILHMNHRKIFTKTVVKKRWSSFLLVFLKIFPMIHF